MVYGSVILVLVRVDMNERYYGLMPFAKGKEDVMLSVARQREREVR